MRSALERYFQNAQDLKVQFSNFDILVEGDEALATFTRSDDFKDAQTGKPVHLEMRVSSIVAKQTDGWKIRGMKKPS
jgi:ketosteroid isomerase-like protein